MGGERQQQPRARGAGGGHRGLVKGVGRQAGMPAGRQAGSSPQGHRQAGRWAVLERQGSEGGEGGDKDYKGIAVVQWRGRPAHVSTWPWCECGARHSPAQPKEWSRHLQLIVPVVMVVVVTTCRGVITLP